MTTEKKTPLKTPRSYRLLCPIARGLDRVGDRWTLLLLRDLHAGPARFSDLQSSLQGMAPNLLTERLRALESDGLIRRKDAGYNVNVYELTPLGASTGSLLFELAKFGSQFPPAEELAQSGNLRLIAVTLKMALASAVASAISGSGSLESLAVELRVDGEPFDIKVLEGNVSVLYKHSEEPEAVISTSYEPLVAVGDGRMTGEELFSKHVKIVEGSAEKAIRLFELLNTGFGAPG